ncbi:ECF transporter S component [Salinibacterium sp. SWN167]|uniref:ECF transporter S component n=1 Tax=Salinibacterium sp. SWN167 TaxID=2792054 RepID=UPI001E390582|nr:ECF transporter S component [Salinibacterium sp. SWN167]
MPADSLDQIADDLQRLRIAAGEVSYSELASRIAHRREENGVSPAAARVARSTVFDIFRTGRSRINAGLVAEIVVALGHDEAEAEAWRSRCLEVRSTAKAAAPHAPLPPAQNPDSRLAFVVVLMVAAVGLNLFGGSVVAKFELPIFLDMIGTAVVAIALGPWQGALVGLSTNVIGVFATVPQTLAYAIVNVVGALVWGYGVRLWRMDKSRLRFLLLNVLVALACTITAVPITVLVFGGVAGHAGDDFIATLRAIGDGLWASVFTVNISISLADKLITGYTALAIIHLLGRLGLSEISRGNGPPLNTRR